MTKCKISSDSKSLFYQARPSDTRVPWPGQREMAAHLYTWACGTFPRPWPGWWVPPSVSASRWRAWVPCEWTWPGRSRAPESKRRNCCPPHRHRRWCWPAPQEGGGWNPVQQALLASRWVSKALALQSVWYWAMAVNSLYLFTSLWYWAMAVSSLYLFTSLWCSAMAVSSLYLFTSMWYSHSCKQPVPIYHCVVQSHSCKQPAPIYHSVIQSHSCKQLVPIYQCVVQSHSCKQSVPIYHCVIQSHSCKQPVPIYQCVVLSHSCK